MINLLRDMTIVVDARSDTRADVQQRADRENVAPLIVDARPNSDATQHIAALVIGKGWGLKYLTPLPLTLEEIFLELTTEEDLGT